jgi:putative ABC transport system substrate-binding protein
MAGFVGLAVSPPRALAQEAKNPVVGFLHASSERAFAGFAAAFREGLREGGFDDPRNVSVEYRWAENDYDRLPALAADLVNRKVAVIAAGGGTIGARAAKRATSTIPIVFVSGGDPVKDGLVESLNQPGGNATGVNQFASVLIAKRFELLREVVSGSPKIGFLINPDNPNADVELRDLREAASLTGIELRVETARSEPELPKAYERLASAQIGGMIVGTDAFFLGRRAQIVAMAQRWSLPASYSVREYVDAGGLMSYGANRPDLWRQAGVYVSRILKGERPQTLPVLQPTRFELVVNVVAAKALGLLIAPALLARADDVLE